MATNIASKSIDKSHTLHPTRILYLRPGPPRSTTHTELFDLTSHLLSSYNDADTASFLEDVQRVLRANPALPPRWAAVRETWWSNASISIVELYNPKIGAANEPPPEGANLHSPVLAYGTSTLTFPPSSPHCTHKVTIRPTSIATRAQSFIKDSVEYLWEVNHREPRTDRAKLHTGQLSLYRADSTKRVEVARYTSQSGKFELGGVLVIGEKDVDGLAAVGTLLGVLNQRDAFYCPGLGALA